MSPHVYRIPFYKWWLSQPSKYPSNLSDIIGPGRPVWLQGCAGNNYTKWKRLEENFYIYWLWPQTLSYLVHWPVSVWEILSVLKKNRSSFRYFTVWSTETTLKCALPLPPSMINILKKLRKRGNVRCYRTWDSSWNLAMHIVKLACT